MTVSLLSAERAIMCDSVDEDGLLAPGRTARDYAALGWVRTGGQHGTHRSRPADPGRR